MAQKNDDHTNVEEHILKLYELHEFKGKGAYGIVWKATDKQTKQQVALKKVFDAFQNPTDAQRTFREVVFLQQLTEHDNIVRLLRIIQSENQKDLYMVFEFMESDLHKVIRAGLLSPLHMQYIIYQLLKCLKYIHSGELIHRDLKPSNLLVDSDCKVKVADFGLARSIASSENHDETPVMTEYVATRWYRAPEILLGSHQYSKAVDMWSVGCILGEMLVGKAIFAGQSTLNQIEKIIELIGRPKPEDLEIISAPLAQQVLENIQGQKKKSYASFFPSASPEFIDFIRQCLLWNPLKRLKIEDAFKHPLMKDFANTEEEKTLKAIIKTPFNDNKKLSIKEYRDRLTNQCQQILQEKQQNNNTQSPVINKVDVSKTYYQSQPAQYQQQSSLQNYLTTYESKQQQKNIIERKLEHKKTEPNQRIIENISVEKTSYNSLKQDNSPIMQKKLVSNHQNSQLNSTTYSQLLQQKYLSSQQKKATSTFLNKQQDSRSPELKKKTEHTTSIPVTKSYSFHTEPKDKVQYQTQQQYYHSNTQTKPPSGHHHYRSTTINNQNYQSQQQVTNSFQQFQSFYQYKDQNKEQLNNQSSNQNQNAMRSKSFEKSPILIAPTSPFQRQKTQVDKPKFTAQNNISQNINQVQKLLQKCAQISNNNINPLQQHKKNISYGESQQRSTFQTVNYNYYDIRNSKFM